MASKDTGFHPSDPEWTRGRAQAVADAESIARLQIGLTRRVTLTETPDPAVNDPDEVEDEAINSYADYLLTLIDKP